MALLTMTSVLLAAFVPPPSMQARSVCKQSASVAMQFEMPKMPKLDLGGIEFESFGDKWDGPGDLQLIPSDVQFKDVDGDTITLRKVRNGKIDYYVGKTLKLSGAVLTTSGNSIQVTGTIKKGTPLSFIGFNLEETITDQMTPADPEDLAAAQALI